MELFLDVIQFLYSLMEHLRHVENIYHFRFVDLLLIFCFLFSLEIQYINHHA